MLSYFLIAMQVSISPIEHMVLAAQNWKSCIEVAAVTYAHDRTLPPMTVAEAALGKCYDSQTDFFETAQLANLQRDDAFEIAQRSVTYKRDTLRSFATAVAIDSRR